MDVYQHTQRSRILFIIIIFVLLFMLFLMYRFGFNWIGAVVFLLMVMALYLFNSLIVKINSEKISVAFGSGLIRKNIPISTIKSAEKVRNKWYYGFGIRLIPGGQMYNVAGLDAVELKLTNGRVFRIGT
ncbi:MAG: hypothetical protein P9L89_03310, partial [Candidatus Celaenobacter polaris]|nr:hypothetical protein [Candidatus Celaenobacter polaris]